MLRCKQGIWKGRLAYKSSSKFSRARITSGRFSYVFCSKSERESESSTFALGPTTGTGNEKRTTLRKSSERGTICEEKVYERSTFFVTPPPPPKAELRRTKDPDSSTTFNFFITKKARQLSHCSLKIWHTLGSSKRLSSVILSSLLCYQVL